MRAVIQRVTRAAVSVDSELISSIGRGICVFIAIGDRDTEKDLKYMARKLLALRLFPDETGRRWAHSITDLGLEMLCVSQFTLNSVLKGNKLDFRRSMAPEESRNFYHLFLEELKNSYLPERIKDGQFGAMMKVDIENDGPVTIILDSHKNDE